MVVLTTADIDYQIILVVSAVEIIGDIGDRIAICLLDES